MDSLGKLKFLNRALKALLRKQISVQEGLMLICVMQNGPMKLEAIMDLALVGKHVVRASDWLRSGKAKDGTPAHVYFLSAQAAELFRNLLAKPATLGVKS